MMVLRQEVMSAAVAAAGLGPRTIDLAAGRDGEGSSVSHGVSAIMKCGALFSRGYATGFHQISRLVVGLVRGSQLPGFLGC